MTESKPLEIIILYSWLNNKPENMLHQGKKVKKARKARDSKEVENFA